MKKVLLAIDGLRPARYLFSYSLQFCRRMRAELVILQIVNPAACRNFLKGFKFRLDKAQHILENTMTAATMAEAGEAELAREYLEAGRQNIEKHFPEDKSMEVACRLEQKVGDPEQEIYAYLEKHPEIVMAIFDSDRTAKQRDSAKHGRHLWERVPSELGIPLVMNHTREQG